jgi:hypothetical protein
MTSVAPPAAQETIISTGLEGYLSWAIEAGFPLTRISAADNKQIKMLFFIFSPPF